MPEGRIRLVAGIIAAILLVIAIAYGWSLTQQKPSEQESAGTPQPTVEGQSPFEEPVLTENPPEVSDFTSPTAGTASQAPQACENQPLMVTASDSDGVYIRSEAGATAEQTVVGGLVPPERFGVAGCKVLNGVNWYYGTKELDGVTGWVHGSFVVPAP